MRIYKLTDQVIITFKMEKDLVEGKMDRIQRYRTQRDFIHILSISPIPLLGSCRVLEDVTNGDVTITEVRVEQTDDGSVDTTG